MTYHLHTEDKGNLDQIVARHFDGWTTSYAEGHWKGTAEASALIEIVTEDHKAIEALAEDIKQTNHQQSVLVEAYPTEERFY